MFSKVLIANRGAIACRIIRTLKAMGIRSVAVYSTADAHSLHVSHADEAICLGDGPASSSYLDGGKILDAACQTGAEAIHPGYGFLSENAEFAEACVDSGIVFIGPSPAQMRCFGRKHTARALAKENGVPLLEGSELLHSLEDALKEATRIGYPVMLKSTAGGGGIGMHVCGDPTVLTANYDAVRRLAGNAFGEGGVFVERYVAVARHIEIQIFGDSMGNVVALGERDCSVQRRNQKVIEETPAPGIDTALRTCLFDSSRRLAKAVGYRSAGTVEFLFDVTTREFYFLEVNTRLQVEHGVTEAVTGIDLVEWMVREAAGELDLSNCALRPQGASIQVRLYAEDPAKSFQPGSGTLTAADFPVRARVETWVERGTEVSPFYDPLIAKIITHGANRTEALSKMQTALAETRIAGITSNLEYLRQITASADFCTSAIDTQWLSTFLYQPTTIDVLDPGTQTSVQDYPGRVGYWAVGVPPSGPMDEYAFRVANRLVGNPENAAALEMTLTGATLRFNLPTTIALCGAMEASIDGVPMPSWQSVPVRAGAIVAIKAKPGGGCRATLAVRGGIDVPDYLGSKSTFSLGKFGGHAGRFLVQGDALPVRPQEKPHSNPLKASESMIPSYQSHWEIMVLYGPHAAPEFFTESFIETFFSADWKVHYNSNRLGIRLMGPKPTFTRPDGGEAGLHPSNIHDTEYAIGAINFTGDMPVILAKDGPSLGGFVCPATIIKDDLWKIGQLRPGDTIRFVRSTFAEAVEAEARTTRLIESLDTAPLPAPSNPRRTPSRTDDNDVLHRIPATAHRPETVYRQAGDRYLLIEYGPIVLDLEFRLRVHSLMEWLTRHPLEGVIELSPGVRSLQINYDSQRLDRHHLLDVLVQAEDLLPATEDIEVPSRIVHLPLAFNADSTRTAIEKYRQSVRDTAPWLPSNIDFIRRINGLDHVDEVMDTVFKASYLVLGLGDVYLGAPCAVPIDPRHRLVTTKYNPARTWTAEGEVGIGGVYMCVYGMESPGGYQLVGRTVPVWNTYRQTTAFENGKPWLLRFFDQIRFYPMPEKELLEYREAFRHGQVSLQITDEVFRARDYNAFLKGEAGSIAAFRKRQQAAFVDERERWVLDGSADLDATAGEGVHAEEVEEAPLPEGAVRISAPITGSMWSIDVNPGDTVTLGQKVACIEAMKTEVSIEAPMSGVISDIAIRPSTLVSAGQTLMVINVKASA